MSAFGLFVCLFCWLSASLSVRLSVCLLQHTQSVNRHSQAENLGTAVGCIYIYIYVYI